MKKIISISLVAFFLVSSIFVFSIAEAKIPGSGNQNNCNSDCSNPIYKGYQGIFVDEKGVSHTIDCGTDYSGDNLFQSGDTTCLRYHTSGWVSSSNRVYPAKVGYKIDKTCRIEGLKRICDVTSSKSFYILQADYCKDPYVCNKATGSCMNFAISGDATQACPRNINGGEDYSGCTDGNSVSGDKIVQAGRQ